MTLTLIINMSLILKRIAAVSLFCAGTAFCAQAQTPSTPSPPPQAAASRGQPSLDPALGIRTVELWPGGAPGALGTAEADIPTLTVFPPRPEHRNGTAVIVAPGGGYVNLAADMEGRDVAAWLAARGVTAFVLRYRLGARYVYPVPLEDAVRAVRWVRAHAAAYGLDPDRVGMLGFSAGGHLAAMAGVLNSTGNTTAPDPVDRISGRPDFLVLGYPWLNAMQPNTTGRITYCSLLPSIPRDRCASFEQPYTPLFHVNRQTPPTFLYITSDDRVVDVDAAIAFQAALHAAGVPEEFHSFAHGPHGSGLGNGDPALDLWPGLLEAWLRGQGLLTPPTAH